MADDADRPRGVAAVVATLLERDPTHRLLALEPGLAELILGDGSRAVILIRSDESEAGDASLQAALQDLIAHRPAEPLKIIILGAKRNRELLARVQPRFMPRRLVQVFHLASEDGSVWWGRRSSSRTPMVAVLEAVARGEVPAVPWDALLGRRLPPPDPARVAAASAERLEWQAMQRRPQWMSRAIAIALAAVFALEILWGGSESLPTLLRMGANHALGLGPEPYRLLASVALHHGWLHFAVNVFVLLSLGQLERWIGGARLAIVFVVSGLGGALLSAALSTAHVAVGASGGIWGLLGAAGAIAWRPRGMIPTSVVPALRRSMIINVIINTLVSFMPGIDLWAHLGGGITGFGLMLALRRGAVRGWVAGAALAAWAASVGWAFVAQQPWELRGPFAWAPHRHGELQWEAPQLLDAPQYDGETIVQGDLERDPLVLSISSRMLSEPRQAEDVRAWSTWDAEAHEGMTYQGRLLLAEGDRPAFEDTFQAASGLELRVRLALGPDVVVRTESVTWPGAPWREIAARMRDSVVVTSPACGDAGCRWSSAP